MPMEHQAVTSATRARISVRAVAAGAIVELVAIGLLLMLAGGLGLWSMGPVDAAWASELGAGLGLFAGVAWVGAAFLGGYIAAVIARATARRDGLLHGLMSWAVACSAAAVLGCTWFMAAVVIGMAKVDLASAFGDRLMLGLFAGDLLALAGALAGGVVGARAEARLAVPAQPELPRPLTTLVPAGSR